MESSVDEDSEWDKSTSEIQSEDSENLYNSRPNRWRGPPQSWRALTEQDRLSYTALERLRNDDLSLHLYNAFALRHPRRRPQPQPATESRLQEGGSSGDVAVEGDELKEGLDAVAEQPTVPEETSWAPPRQWTAWPLNAHLVPADDFLTKTEDEDKAFTFRRVESTTPAFELAEIISSTILRCAKDKFRERSRAEAAQGGQHADSEHEHVVPDAAAALDESDAEDGKQQNMDVEDLPLEARRKADPILQPAVATDEDLSYELLRPSAQAILAKLDHTLTILHNSRMTSVEGLVQQDLDALLSPSSAASSSDDFDQYSFDSFQPSRSRRRNYRTTAQATRSRHISLASQPDDKSGAEPSSAGTQPRKRGRPRSLSMKEGESKRDFLIRRAVTHKKRRPVFSDEEDQSEMTDVKPAPGDEGHTRDRKVSPSCSEATPSVENNNSTQNNWTHPLDRFNLRDWSDVMGAAALSRGFSPTVIARATQRCANLFGQGMEMRTINENGCVKTKRYIPGYPDIVPQESEEEDEDEDYNQVKEGPKQNFQSECQMEGASNGPPRSSGRMPSIELGGDDPFPASSDAESRGRHGAAGTGPRRSMRVYSRSRSRGPVKQLLYCSHPECERATRPFNRSYNLQRHLDKVHDGQEGPGSVTKRTMPHSRLPSAAASDDLLGGIHRDGFLEPIRVHRGWRGEDNSKRTGPSISRQQSLELELEGEEVGIMGADDEVDDAK
ncbi:hypothetical protein BD289DRAFT_427215 [Coniella lustricola]|uniref:Rrn9 domain-containing protein n=1 Tax=Coniella lustricola TaxID=2025994 RepID=A0A2T3AFC5_9PEZI|nr:hypothetical protein BD289DRAFT_427215 [Coniella lustricola]